MRFISVFAISIFAVLLFAQGVQAATTTIDFNEFDDAPPPGFVDFGGVWVSEIGEWNHAGFRWGNPNSYSAIMRSSGPAAPEDGAGYFSNPDYTTYMTLLDESGSFTLHTLDAWNRLDATVTGHFAAGGYISAQLQDLFVGGEFVFGAEWTGLSSVGFSDPVVWDNEFEYASEHPFIIDDVVVTISAVPVPAAVWLFGSALAGLGWMRRKQIA